MMVNIGKACLAPESFLGLDMTIPTEPIGSIPRPQKVITAFEQYEQGSLSREEFESICSEAVRETIESMYAATNLVQNMRGVLVSARSSYFRLAGYNAAYR
jgi:hypothetical protein